MKMKDKPQSVAESEATLRVLEGKREKLVRRGDSLPQRRRDASYAAHADQDAEARKQLDKVNAEVATHASEVASLDDAIAGAKNRVLMAQAFENDIAKRAKAREAVDILVAFRKAGHDLDAALAHRC